MSGPTFIPQCDPGAAYRAHGDELDEVVRRVLAGGRYILGPEVEAFEAEFARFIGVRRAVGVASGTDALELALRGCGVGAGHVVYTVSHTAVATVAAIERCGAAPVLVDIDPGTFTMDARSLGTAIERHGLSRWGAILPVHLYGQPADMKTLAEVARHANLAIIEDCAQSHGAMFHGRRTGTWGDAAAFSFYPTKNLGAIGDGGAVVTDREDVADRVRALREYGWRTRYVSDMPGINSRLDEIQAAMLRVKLCRLDEANASRRRIAAAYGALLDPRAIHLPLPRPGVEHVYHQYVVRVKQRDALQAFLAAQRIGTLVHYPQPVHAQPAYHRRVACVDLVHSESAAREVLSLPMFPELGDDDVTRVAAAVNAFTRGARA